MSSNTTPDPDLPGRAMVSAGPRRLDRGPAVVVRYTPWAVDVSITRAALPPAVKADALQEQPGH